MDQQKLIELLQSSLIPDTRKVKAATAELRKNYLPRPEALLGLLHVAISHPDSHIRHCAAVHSQRLLRRHWKKIDSGQKPAVRNEILQAVVREQDAKCRHSLSRVVAGLAVIDFEQKEWQDLIPSVLQLITSDNVARREVGSYVLFSLLEADPAHFNDHLPKLFALFATTIRDPVSRDVRLNTMLSISSMLLLIHADEDEKSVAAITDLIPAMVEVLKDVVLIEDEEKTKQAFEVLQSFLAYESALLSKHFKDLVQFMLELACNTTMEAEVRDQALDFLTQSVRYRRMKIQAIPDMGANLTRASMKILTELGEDEDEEELSPASNALALLDQLSNDLPPRQVVVPLLSEFQSYATSVNATHRRAAVLALGTCAEGAPDFFGTQIDSLMPAMLRLLHDPSANVRLHTLVALMGMGEDLAELMKSHHEAIMTALLANLDASQGNESHQKRLEIIRAVCGAIHTLSEGLGPEIMNKYAVGLIGRIGTLLSQPDLTVRASAARALGSLALSTKADFLPYLKETMEVMFHYLTLEEGEDELLLRNAVTDAMSRIAVGVGADAFKDYVVALLVASEKSLALKNPRLRETTFVLWGRLAVVYGAGLGNSLDGIFKGLFDSLELGEEELDLGADDDVGLIEGELAKDGNKIMTRAAQGHDEEDGMDDDDWSDLEYGVSAAALEKEVAMDVLGDVIHAVKEASAPFLEKVIEVLGPFVNHSYEGCRKASISTLWRTYACAWEMMERSTGEKWQPGLPLNFQPGQNIIILGEVATSGTLAVWGQEDDRDVVTELNRNVAAALKVCGPAILAYKDMVQSTVTVVGTIIIRSHPCQQDLGDEKEDQAVEGSSEWDWLVIDTALDVVIGLSAALGAQFAELWKVFEKPVMRLASSQESVERSTAVGVIAEVTANMGAAVSPNTETLLALLLHRLRDEDKEAKSNAAYAMGLLCYHSTDTATYLPAYNEILGRLEPLLRMNESRLQDNATGCVCRMILAHPDQVPLSEVLPVVVGLLPLKEDYEENKPVYECIAKLYEFENPIIRGLTPALMPVFGQVLGGPEEQLEPSTRQLVQNLVAMIQKTN